MKLPKLATLFARLFKSDPEPVVVDAMRRIEEVAAADSSAAETEIATAESAAASARATEQAANDQVERLTARATELRTKLADLNAQLATGLNRSAADYAQAVASGDDAAQKRAEKSAPNAMATREEAARIGALVAGLEEQAASCRATAATARATLEKATHRLGIATCERTHIAWDLALNDLALASGRLFDAYERAVRLVPVEVQLLKAAYFSNQRSLVAQLDGSYAKPGRSVAPLTQDAARRCMRLLAAPAAEVDLPQVLATAAEPVAPVEAQQTLDKTIQTTES